MNCREMLKWAVVFGGLPVLALAEIGDGPPQLAIQSRFDRSKFEVGEAIPAILSIVNQGVNDYLVQASTEPTGALDGWSFQVTDAAGMPVARPAAWLKSSNWLGSWLTLRRHERSERKFFLNHWVLPLAPG